MQLQGCAFRRDELPAVVADVWPLAEEDPDVAFWAREFRESGHGSVAVRQGWITTKFSSGPA